MLISITCTVTVQTPSGYQSKRPKIHLTLHKVTHQANRNFAASHLDYQFNIDKSASPLPYSVLCEVRTKFHLCCLDSLENSTAVLRISWVTAGLPQRRAGFYIYGFCSVKSGMCRKDKLANSGKFQARNFFRLFSWYGGKCEGKVRRCTGTEALYRNWGSVQAVRPLGGVEV